MIPPDCPTNQSHAQHDASSNIMDHNIENDSNVSPQMLPNYETNTTKPQLAYEMYKRLLAIAESTTNVNQHRSSPNDILLAAFTGCNLMYTTNDTKQVQ